jgi:ABC-type lipoprotein release transport system permease subunit
LSPALAADIGASAGSRVLVRVERPSAIPIESLHGRKDNLGRTLRLTVRSILAPADLGEFSLQPQQGAVRALFVPLQRLQQDLDVAGRVNALLVADRSTTGTRPDFETLLRRHAALEDVGLSVRVFDSRREIAVESAAGMIDETRAKAIDEAAATTAMDARPILTYLANTMRSGDREVPYSLVTAIDLSAIVPAAGLKGPPYVPMDPSAVAPRDVARPFQGRDPSSPPIVLNDWAARELGVKAGDPLTLEYYVWEEPGRLVTRRADFRIAVIVPIAGVAADRDLVPAYPGITEARSLLDWDPPFPIDLRRVRRIDEAYWDTYRTTPKAFIPLEVGQTLWRSRYGDRTSVRVVPGPGQSLAEARDQLTARLRATLDPMAIALSVRDVREEGVAASRGATDFGEYFTYFSFFLVMSAVVLAALFFRLGVEQRAREVGLLRAVGFTDGGVRRLFAYEGLLLAAIGAALGVAGAVAYAWVMMFGLRTWWTGAVGTSALSLHVAPVSLAAGAIGALIVAVVCIWWTLRGLARISERSLLAGQLESDLRAPSPESRAPSPELLGAIAFGFVGAALMVATIAGALDRTGAFFGAGTSLLAACLFLIAFNLRRPARRLLDGHGWWPVMRLGLRNAAHRPGRSVLAISVIASATFILISVDAFRREGAAATDRHSGVGGYSLLVDLMLPIAHDPASREGRDALGLEGAADVTIDPFRVLPGDDASCLNLYEPKNPRVLGASQPFIASGRFRFQSSLASSDAERTNPWLILNRSVGDDIVPAIADANSITYVLHKALGEDVVVSRGGRHVRLRLVAALADSIFQSELVISDVNFVKLFPEQEGYRLLLVETPRAAQVATAIREGASDLGAAAISTAERLAEFHRVENTYLSTFQTLGGLGLLVGTVGLAAVLLRNVLERRRELALLGAAGYRRAHIFAIVLAENALLLGWGLAIGALCALVAIAPAAAERGGRLPVTAGGATLVVAVLVAGLVSSAIATRAALRAPLLESLRAE